MKLKWVFALCLVLGLIYTAAGGQERRKAGARQNRGRVLNRLDANNDGRISRDEWSRRPQGFDHLDTDRDGFITREELQAQSGKRRGGAKRIRKSFNEMDKNNDNTVSRDEWTLRPELFERLDRDNNGVITREELRRRRKQRRPAEGNQPASQHLALA